MTLRIVMTLLSLLVVVLMAWDQVRLRGMTPSKRGILGLLLAVLLANIWIGK